MSNDTVPAARAAGGVDTKQKQRGKHLRSHDFCGRLVRAEDAR
jgi:hypothetical protein